MPAQAYTGVTKADLASNHTKKEEIHSPRPLAGKQATERDRASKKRAIPQNRKQKSVWKEDAKEPDMLGRRQSVGASLC